MKAAVFAPRDLIPVRKHADSHALRHVVAYAANPEVEIARCETLIGEAKKSLEVGDPDTARRILNDVGNVVALHESVQETINRGMFLELHENKSRG